MSSAMWGLSSTDAVYSSGQVSVATKQSCVELVYRGLTKVEVLFQFAIYDYDPAAKKYFSACNAATRI